MGVTPTHTKRPDEVVVFLHDVQREGLISDSLTETLINYRTFSTKPAVLVAPAVTASVAQPHPIFQAATPIATRPQPPAQSAPFNRPTPPKMPSRTELWARFAKKRSKKLWGSFTADFAANALTYLGVLLSVVVIFTFFAFGYFSEFIDADHKEFRPLAEIGVVAFFLGLAWVLRHRTGIPQTSAAIEMIGIVLIPVMLSASFRDGCTPAYRAWCLPPDVDGPGRWAAYGVVGLIAAGIYYAYARRRHIYSYLVGPMLWISIGAFALYLEDGIGLFRSGDSLHLDRFSSDGISAPQLIAVLTAIGLTIVIAGRIRTTAVGKTLAVPLVRSGIFFTPFLLVLSVVFSYNDAVDAGVKTPKLADLAWPNVAVCAIAALVFAAARKASFARDGLGDRLSRDLAVALETATYLSLGAAWLFTAGFGVSPAWLGTGLVAYAAAVGATQHIAGGSATVALWTVRAAAGIGVALALIDPGPTLVTWGTLTALIAARTILPTAGVAIARYLPTPTLPIDRQVQMWIPALVATLGGAARLGWPGATSSILLLAGAIYVSSRYLPFADVRTFAGAPAAGIGIAALAVEIFNQVFGNGLDAYRFSAFLALLAVVFAMMTIGVVPRLGSAVILVQAAAVIALRELVGNTAWETAWIDTAVLAAAGVILVAAARRRFGLTAGILGHSMIVAATMRSLVFEETAIAGLVILAAVHAFEAMQIEKGYHSVFARLADRSGLDAELIRALPAAVALTAVSPIAVLVGRQIPIEETTRFGPLLAIVGWVYAVVLAFSPARIRRVAIALAWIVGLGAVVASVPSVTDLMITTLSAAALTAVLAIAAGQPRASLASWLLAVAGAVLAASRAGVGFNDLYLVVHGCAVAMVVGAATVQQLKGRGPATGWLAPPAMLGSALLPVGLLLSDGDWLPWVALAAASAYAALGWSTRIGGFSFPVTLSLSVAYGAAFSSLGWADPSAQPLVWMPLAMVFVATATVLPGRNSWDMAEEPSPGILASGLALGVWAVAASRATVNLDVALVAMAVLLAGAYLVKRRFEWLIAAAGSLVAAGLVAGGYWAPLAMFGLALVSGYLADLYRDTEVAAALRGVTTASFGLGYVLLASWLRWDAAEALGYTAAVSAVLVVGAAIAEVRTGVRVRVRVWRHPAFLLSQAGATGVTAIALMQLGRTDAAGVIATVLAFEAATAALVGSIKRSESMTVGSAALAAAAYALVPQWLTWTEVEFVAATGAVGAAFAVLATAATRIQATSRTAQLWLRPLHSLPVAAAIAIVVSNSGPDGGASAKWSIAAALVGTAIYVTANAWAAPPQWRMRGLAVVGYLTGAVFMVAAASDESMLAVILPIWVVALVAAVAAGLVAETDSPWRVEMASLSAGLAVAGLGGAMSAYGITSTQVGLGLVMVGVGFAAYGILARNLAAFEAALVTWLGAFLVLVNGHIALSLHATLLLSSVILLGVLELERIRRHIDELPVSDALNQVEWALMLAPLGLAAFDMFNSLWFGLVLLAEGLTVAAWGALTEVRRRALLGVAAMVLAVVLSVAIPALHGLMVGLAGGTWLIVGAVAATVFIAAGSAIERQRHAIGRGLAHIAEILEDWA